MSTVISAIIVNYNAGPLLRSCVDSILNCPLAVEVIVIDNASNDDSLNALQNLPRVQIIRNPSNRGFAAACNQGIALAKADNLFFINPDCTFRPGALADLLAWLRADPEAGMAGGNLVNTDGTEQQGGRRAIPTPWRTLVRTLGLSRFSSRWPKLFFDFYLHMQPLPSHPIEVEAISGACMMVKREVLAQIGIWDEKYFLHCEDLDWCMRFRLKGWKILFIPSATVMHEQGVCGNSRPIFVEWHKHKGMILFYRKFFQHQYPGVLMWLVILGVWLRFGFKFIYYMAKHVVNLLRLVKTQSHAVSVAEASVPEYARQGSKRVGVFGATSFVGKCLLPLLTDAGWHVTAFSRRSAVSENNRVIWRQLPSIVTPSFFDAQVKENESLQFWICVTPIWVLPDYFTFLEAQGVRRVVVVSSTSRFTKDDSSDPEERELATRFVNGEAKVRAWAESHGVEWIILRPTLIYGFGQDKNITEIARLIRRFGFFPLFGKAEGLRQPIHAQDVARACMAALQAPSAANHAYNISGAETLSYNEMVTRVFQALDYQPRMLTIPLWVFRLFVILLRYFPRYQKWSSAMAERMNRNLVFDHAEATRDLGFNPRRFELSAKDLPS